MFKTFQRELIEELKTRDLLSKEIERRIFVNLGEEYE
jgi:hypothetical protein